nr:MAG TPA: tyrosine recombinase [Bacteriophage sp.]
MLTEEKINAFAEKYSDRSGEFVISTLRHVMDYEAEHGYELFDFTKDDFVKMFSRYNWVNSSRSFKNVKSIITGYIKSENETSMYDLAEFSESDVSADNMYEDKYFASVDEFVDFLNKYEEPYQIRMNVIAVLYWIGLTSEEVSNLTINDVDFESCTVLSKIDVDAKLMDIIKQCYEMKQYDAPNKGGYRAFYVMNGDYILRKTEDSISADNNPKVSTNTIHNYFTRLNDILERRYHSKTLDRRHLVRNGEYVKVYNYCKNHPEYNFTKLGFDRGGDSLADIIGRECCKTAYLSFRQGYKGWVEYFHEN